VQGYYKRDDAFFQQYHAETKTHEDSNGWLQRWVVGTVDRAGYVKQLGQGRVAELGVKNHAYTVLTDYGY
jgi:glutaconate CoA-transferase subunit A